MAFLLIAVTLDVDIAVLGIQNLALWQLGDTLGTMRAAGRTCGGSEPDLLWFRNHVGTLLETSFGSDGLNSIFCSGLVSRSFFASIFNPNPDS